ncbi:restriction endonuclease subunit S [uncultured Nonlabens sp.]|uniref:restriction endonuclease subunit S n=1 Tax=uncultured Nonlabens sp. TaxID=859306 RepID=UPI0026030BA8|nr:restriction endonuclease subunit S [uncultured Nonlabens sp.]
MESNYSRLGDLIVETGPKNSENEITLLQGISNNKHFQKAKTNTVGIKLETYRIVRTNEFAFNRATTRNGEKISIARRKGEDCVVSPSYRIFKIKDETLLNSEYLEMWFKRPAFDRYARFRSHGSAHEFFDYDEMSEVELPVPSLEKQQEIVADYNAVQDRIRINEQLNTALEETAQALYKHWFVDFQFPVKYANSSTITSSPLERTEERLGYKSSGGAMVYNEELDMEIPLGWEVVSFLDELNINGGGTPKTTNPDFWNGSIPFFTPKDVGKSFFTINTEKYLTEEGLENCSSKLYNQNTIFITARGTVGAISISGRDMAMNQSCYAFIDKDNLQYYGHQSAKFAIDNLKRQAVGAVFSALVTKDFESTMILKPSLNVKQKFNHLLEPIYSNILNAQIENIKHRELSDLLLSKMATVVDGKELVN